MVPAMYNLCSKADLIVPNVTEAALLLGDPLPGVGSAEQAAAQAARLTRIAPQVVVTGVTGIGGGRYIGCVGAARGGQGYAVKTPLQPRMFHGTGDIFAAVLVGRILRGNVPQAAVQAAAAFVAECDQADARGSRRAAGCLAGERPAETAAGVKKPRDQDVLENPAANGMRGRNAICGIFAAPYTAEGCRTLYSGFLLRCGRSGDRAGRQPAL